MLSMEDERTITRLLHNYAWGIDRRDWALFKSCFAPDFVADYTPFGMWKGPETMTDMMMKANESHPATLHSLSNLDIRGNGNEARASSHVHAILMPMEKDGKATEFFGIYEDELIKIDGTWKIRHRRFTVVK